MIFSKKATIYCVMFVIFLLETCWGQVHIKENNIVTFHGSLANTKLIVKNMGASSSAEFYGPTKKLPDNVAYLVKEDVKKTWVYNVMQGSVYSGMCVEMPEDFSLQINTPIGVLIVKKQVQFYMIIRSDMVKIVLQKGKVQFLGAVADQCTLEHNETDMSVNYTLTIPDRKTRHDVASKNTTPPSTSIPTIPLQPAVSTLPSSTVPNTSQYVTGQTIVWKTGLEVLHYDSRDPAPIGETMNYTVKVKNQSDADIVRFKLTSYIPTQAMFVVASVNPSCAFQASNNLVVFDTIPKIAPGESITFILTFKVKEMGVLKHIVEMSSDSWGSTKIRTEESTQTKN